MNERIKELALQAGLEMCSCGCDMPTRQSAKFAKLIIQECAGVGDSGDSLQDGGIARMIKEHFGVE